MLHSSSLSALASISSSVTCMIKTSLKHLSQDQNMGARRWGVGVEAKGNGAHLCYLFLLHLSLLSLVSKTSTMKSPLGSPACCQSCTMIQHQLHVCGSDDIILTAIMHYASNSISCEWSSLVFNEFAVRVCVCVCFYFGQVNPIRFHFQ